MKLTETVSQIGVNDRNITLFEGQYPVEHGMSYNSYLIRDEKIAVLDTVDAACSDEWFANLEAELNGDLPDYLIVQHMEPDHSANILRFAEKYPESVIVSGAKSFPMMKNFFGTDFENRRIVVGEGDELDLGSRKLTFVTAPMVHWPEVILTYDPKEEILFSADAFGKFGTTDADEDWTDEARRYFIGIVGKYGIPVQTVLKKAQTLSIRSIFPLHGPTLTGDLAPYLNLYSTWSSYRPEQSAVAVVCASVYGNTLRAAEELIADLHRRGIEATLHDLTKTDVSYAVADAFRCNRLVVAGVTYNGDLFPCMKTFLHALCERNYQNRTVGLIENGSWAPIAAKNVESTLSSCKNLTYLPTRVRILSALNAAGRAQLTELANELEHAAEA